MNGLLRYNTGLTCTLVGYVFLNLLGMPAYAADLVRDPTRPLMDVGAFGGPINDLPEEEQEKPLKLQSIIFNEAQAIAVINSQKVQVGDIIEGYELIEMTDYSVNLVRDNKELLLSLYRLKIKTNEN